MYLKHVYNVHLYSTVPLLVTRAYTVLSYSFSLNLLCFLLAWAVPLVTITPSKLIYVWEIC